MDRDFGDGLFLGLPHQSSTKWKTHPFLNGGFDGTSHIETEFPYIISIEYHHSCNYSLNVATQVITHALIECHSFIQ